MSSADDSESAHNVKKRKLQRACDYCRRKKIKCDGPEMPNNTCSKCYKRRTKCTYTESATPSTYPRSYVENLEGRLARMEQLMKQMRSKGEPPQESGDRTSPSGASPMASSSLGLASQTPVSSEDFEHSDRDYDEQEIVDGLRDLNMDPKMYRYYGSSSGLVFLRTALDLKDRFEGRGPHNTRPWELCVAPEHSPTFTEYPPEDLLDPLVELYFRNINDFLPFLHEPTFKQAISDGLHRRSGSFGGTVLLACALGSRWSRDPRVYVGSPENWQSAGWMWFDQVERARKSVLAPTQLHDLQTCVLMALYMQGMITLQGLWSLIGSGLRMAVEVGVHRRKRFGETRTVEGELWRRAFWALIYLEWAYAYGLGRPASIHAEDMDLESPVEVDDEYWTTPEGEPLFEQPAGKPSKVSFFVYSLRMSHILAFACRTIYSTDKSRAHLGHGDMKRWEERVVAELDSALNRWMESLPSHLRWDPACEDRLTLTQSATLFAQWHFLHIAVHRPFISRPQDKSPLSFPSLIICLNAARSTIQVLDALHTRTGSAFHRNMGTLLMSSLLLMMNVTSQKRAGRSVDVTSDMQYVRKSLKMLDDMKHEVHVAQILCQFVEEMCTVVTGATEPANETERTNPTSDVLRPEAMSQPGPSIPTQSPDNIRTHITGTDLPSNVASPSPFCNTDTQEHLNTTLVSGNIFNPQSDVPAPTFTASQSSSHTTQPATYAIEQPASSSSSSSNVVHPAYLQPQRAEPQLGAPLPVSMAHEAQASSAPVPYGYPPNTGYPHEEAILGQIEPLPTGNPHWQETAHYPFTESAMPASSFAFNSEMLMGFPGDWGNAQKQDFAIIDETMRMWPGASPTFGLNDWRAYFNNENDRSFDFNFTGT